ncbi:M23 family metallopeptidase [Caldifermentibacillus hisashii]|uniref:M23 family metallopeptidase n=1 Tax=Caldifermentibacillus hisashii TaxID=996558 RepID=UPI0031B67D90
MSSAAVNFIWPADGTVTSGFGSRGGGSFHYGIDIAKSGTVPIKASASGTVSRSYNSSSYGEVVFIQHNINGQVYETVYAHMRSGSRTVSAGQTISQGQILGYMGSTGDATGQHLHFELHVGTWNSSKSNAVNPLNYLGKELEHQNPPGIGTAISKFPEGYGVNYYDSPNGTFKGRITRKIPYIVYEESDGWIDIGQSSWIKLENMDFTRYLTKSKYPEGYGVNYYDSPNGTFKGRIYAPTPYFVYARKDGWVDIGGNCWIPEENLIIWAP